MQEKVTNMIQKGYQIFLDKLSSPSTRSIIWITIFLYGSKVLGFLRQSLILDMNPQASDILLASLNLPNIITSTIIAGTIINSVLPVASRVYGKNKDTDRLNAYLESMFVLSVAIMLVIICVCFLFTDQLLRITSSPDLIQKFEIAGLWEAYITVTRILLLGPLFFILQGVFATFLQIKNKFFIYSLAGVIANLGTLSALIFFERDSAITVAIGMMLGTGMSTFLYMWDCHRNGWHISSFFLKPMRSWFANTHLLLDTWKLFLPRLFMIDGIIFSNFLMVRFAQGRPGQITAFDYSLSIAEIFLTLVVSVSTVFFPNISSTIQRHVPGDATMWRQLRKYTRLIVLISLGGIAATWIIAPIIVWVLQQFSSGQIQTNGDYVVDLARIATVGLLFQSLALLWSKFFHARERLLLPAILSILAGSIQVLFVWLMSSSAIDRGILIMLGLILNFFVLFCGYGLMIWREYRREEYSYTLPTN